MLLPTKHILHKSCKGTWLCTAWAKNNERLGKGRSVVTESDTIGWQSKKKSTNCTSLFWKVNSIQLDIPIPHFDVVDTDSKWKIWKDIEETAYYVTNSKTVLTDCMTVGWKINMNEILKYVRHPLRQEYDDRLIERRGRIRVRGLERQHILIRLHHTYRQQASSKREPEKGSDLEIK